MSIVWLIGCQCLKRVYCRRVMHSFSAIKCSDFPAHCLLQHCKLCFTCAVQWTGWSLSARVTSSFACAGMTLTPTKEKAKRQALGGNGRCQRRWGTTVQVSYSPFSSTLNVPVHQTCNGKCIQLSNRKIKCLFLCTWASNYSSRNLQKMWSLHAMYPIAFMLCLQFNKAIYWDIHPKIICTMLLGGLIP